MSEKIIIYDFNQYKLLYLKYCQKEKQYVLCEIQTLVPIWVKIMSKLFQGHYILAVTTKWTAMSFSSFPISECILMKNWRQSQINLMFNSSSQISIFSKIKKPMNQIVRIPGHGIADFLVTVICYMDNRQQKLFSLDLKNLNKDA